MSAAGRRLGRLMTQSVEPRLVAGGVDSTALVDGIRRRRDRRLCAFPLICINTCLPTMKPLRRSCIFGDSHLRVRQTDALSQRCEERLASLAEATQLEGPEDQAMECMTGMSKASNSPFGNVLDPMERISETLFGLIMALTFICSLGVATGTSINIQTMLIGALGCNLAWGIVDGGLYLLARINSRGDKILTLRAIRQAPDPESARRVIADALPPELATILPLEQLELMRQKLQRLPEPTPGPGLTKARLDRSTGPMLAELSFDVPGGDPVPAPERRQTGAARLLRRRYRDAVLLWLRVRNS